MERPAATAVSAPGPQSRILRLECSAQTLFRIFPMDTKLLELLACPVTKGPLLWRPDQQELLSLSARLAYPVRDGIPVLLENEARPLSDAEIEAERNGRQTPAGT